ncbi:MAG: ribosomal protein S18-alanine N-acetyltransferase [Clostridia bacterium]
MDISKLTILPMTLADLEKIKTTLTKDFDNFWNFEIFKEELVHTNSYYLVLYYQDSILGFAGFKKILEEADLMNIVIAKAYRGQGFSSLLLKELLQTAYQLANCRSMTLEVSATNAIAIHLYKSFGFTQIGLRKKYYFDKTDAILMKKDLP